MKSLTEYIKQLFKSSEASSEKICEMATIGTPILNRQERLISVHGVNSGDRSRPHLHMYLNSDVYPFNKFNFEIAIDEILCYDEINLIRMTDKKNHVKYTNRNKCSWNSYAKLKNDFENWLFNEKPTKRGDFIDNLDVIIYYYNEESTVTHQPNPLLYYIKDHGMKVLDKHKKYFSEDDIGEYPECFE